METAVVDTTRLTQKFQNGKWKNSVESTLAIASNSLVYASP